MSDQRATTAVHINSATRVKLREHLQYLLDNIDTAEGIACVSYAVVNGAGYYCHHTETWPEALGLAARLQHVVNDDWTEQAE